ncbi:MAG: hypothetical protein E7633_05090 [Ruminococcaceae bacterium]|nr:hypothetical protein [Oscillospiraceae bacterium]
MKYNSSESRKDYFPPVISNGNISFAPDAEGMIGYTFSDYRNKGVSAFDGIVVRSARRTGICNGMQARLFPFGKFSFYEGSPLDTWEQELCVEDGCFNSDCHYNDGVKIYSQGFIHPELNIYALKKTFAGMKTGDSKTFSYEVTLCGYDHKISEYINILYIKTEDNVCRIGFKMFGINVFVGEINVFVDKEFKAEPIENGFRIIFTASNNESVSFFYYLEDNMGETDFSDALNNYKAYIDKLGFEGLLQECRSHFKDFYALGYVKTSDERLNSIYKVALYSIKSSTSKSIAVGFNNGAWDGRYFAFDEYISFLGLCGANRLQLAKRVPTYRLNSLGTAIRRASDSHRNAYTEDMARYNWESGETDNMELAPSGYWLEHIFHMPLIGIGALEYYEYSQDKEFLSDCYRMIRACSKFMTKHMIYKDGDKLYVGKCTDLERLGSSVERAFMTTCGVIRLLKSCSKVANMLETDKEYADECEEVAAKLYESLPYEGNMYVPHPECKQKSIGVFACKFPFDVLDDGDEKMLNAWEDFEINGAAFGNMYPSGKGISPWYASWKALAYARSVLKDKAYLSLKQACDSVGAFDELFEIHETNILLRPWFTTAAGTFVSAVNELLLQSDGKIIRILPAFPHSQEVSFKLAAKGGVTVEAKVKNGDLVDIMVIRNGENVTDQFVIEF